MESNIRFSDIMYNIDFVQEFYSIAEMFDEEFAKIVRDASIKRYYSNIIQKNKLSDNDLSYTDITDYLVENEEGKVQIGDKMYYYPPYMFDIINDLVKRIVAVRCEAIYQKMKASTKNATMLESKSDFKTKYYVRLKKTLGLLRQDLKVHNDETNRMIMMPDNDKEEFKLRQIRCGVLLAYLDNYKLSVGMTLSK